MAKRRNSGGGHKGRDVDGIMLLDKPQGLTSNQALQKVKRIFNARKAGHTGSLDPLATGMLPVCFGEATKISAYLLDADKRYIAVCKLGVRTDSADADGNVISSRPVPPLSETGVTGVLAQFTGQIQQVPPMHSAVKKNGVPLYKLAHQGIEVEREARTVTVYQLKLLRLDKDILEIDVHCSKGTYVRTLADDIGETLGCGAHITALRRLQVDPFEGKSMYTFEQLNTLKEQGVTVLDRALLPIESGLANWPVVKLDADAAFYLRQGQSVFIPQVLIPQVKTDSYVRLHDGSGVFMGIGVVRDDGRIAPKRLMNQPKIR